MGRTKGETNRFRLLGTGIGCLKIELFRMDYPSCRACSQKRRRTRRAAFCVAWREQRRHWKSPRNAGL